MSKLPPFLPGVMLGSVLLVYLYQCKTPGQPSQVKSGLDISDINSCPTGIYKVTCRDGRIEYRSEQEIENDSVCLTGRIVAKTDAAFLFRPADGTAESSLNVFMPSAFSPSGYKINCKVQRGTEIPVYKISPVFKENRRVVTLQNLAPNCNLPAAEILVKDFSVTLDRYDLNPWEGYPYPLSGYNRPSGTNAPLYSVADCYSQPTPPSGWYPSGWNPPSNPSGWNPPPNPSGWNPPSNPSGWSAHVAPKSLNTQLAQSSSP